MEMLKKKIFLGLATGLFLFASTANATLINTFAENSYYSDSDTADQGTIVSEVYYDPYYSDYPEASAAASSQGSLAVASRAGSSTGISSAEASWSNMFTNETAIDQFYALDFSLSGGYLDLWNDINFFHRSASYSIDILLDDSSVWSSSAEIVTYDDRTDESWAELQLTGTDLGGTFVSTYTDDGYGYSWGSANYTFDPFQGTIDIGKISAGDSFSLQYALSVYTEGNQYFESKAYLGNPEATPFSPGFSGSVTAAPVPEPTTMLLFGTGLAGLAGTRIRRKKK